MRRPNIILITADQHRWDCLGYAGNLDVQTPHLDALARHGVNFSQTICQYPVCAPSRATIMTGQYPSAHGVLENRGGLPLSATTLSGLLHGTGYHTAAVGKMHFSPPRANYGFDFMRLAEQEGPGREEDDYHQWLKDQGLRDDVDYWDQVDRQTAPDEYWRTFGAMSSNLPEKASSSTWIGDQAVRFVQGAREPFFLWVSFMKPHHPFDPPVPWDARYDPDRLTLPDGFCLPIPREDRPEDAHFDLTNLTEKSFRRILSNYYATISHLDAQIGRILATVSGRGRTNNVVVYSSDHGDYMGQHGLVFKNQRPYDSVLRVPLLISGVTGQRRGVEDSALAQLTDVMPTLLETADIPVPQSVQGKSLLPVLRGESTQVRPIQYAEWPSGTRIARTTQSKLVESEHEDYRAFHDLRADPHEFHNKLGQREIVQEQVRLANFLRRPRLAGNK